MYENEDNHFIECLEIYIAYQEEKILVLVDENSYISSSNLSTATGIVSNLLLEFHARGTPILITSHLYKICFQEIFHHVYNFTNLY